MARRHHRLRRVLNRPLPVLLGAVVAVLVAVAATGASLSAIRSGEALDGPRLCPTSGATAAGGPCVTRQDAMISGPIATRRTPGSAWEVRDESGERLARVDVATLDSIRLDPGPVTALVEPDGDVTAFVTSDGTLVRSRAVGWTGSGLSLGIAGIALGLAIGLGVTAARQRRATGSWVGSGERVPFGSVWAAPLVVTGSVSVLLSRFEVPAAVSLVVLAVGVVTTLAAVALRAAGSRRREVRA